MKEEEKQIILKEYQQSSIKVADFYENTSLYRQL